MTKVTLPVFVEGALRPVLSSSRLRFVGNRLCRMGFARCKDLHLRRYHNEDNCTLRSAMNEHRLKESRRGINYLLYCSVVVCSALALAQNALKDCKPTTPLGKQSRGVLKHRKPGTGTPEVATIPEVRQRDGLQAGYDGQGDCAA